MSISLIRLCFVLEIKIYNYLIILVHISFPSSEVMTLYFSIINSTTQSNKYCVTRKGKLAILFAGDV